MRTIISITSLLSTLLLIPLQAVAGTMLYEEGDSNLKFSGDLRLRLEQDWDSVQGNGVERDDRLRIRARARLRLDAQINKHWSAVFRLRTGNDESQQSPHITLYDFDDNDTGPADFNFDLWYGQYKTGGWSIWAGRNQLGLFRQDEDLMSDDVTAAGIGTTYAHDMGKGQLKFVATLASAPAGMRGFSGQIAAGQVIYAFEGEDFGYTVAGAYLGIDANPNDPDGALLLTNNNTRDYQTAVFQAQLRLKSVGKPLKIAATAGRNLENYDGEPSGSFSEFHKDDVDFYIMFVNWGSYSNRGDWLLGYYYSYIEALAISSSYAEDNWVRWGDINQTRATNMKGSEFRLAYGLGNNMNIIGRLYLVDAIDLLNATDTTKEDGKRARIDFNIRF